MAMLVKLDGRAPIIADGVFLAPNAVLIGDVTIGAGASVWFGAVVRADFDRIEIGAGTAVQDNAVLHVAAGLPTVIGENVIIGHGAILEGCRVDAHAVIGMGAIVLQRAHVGGGAMLAAGSVLTDGKSVSAGMLAAGIPAREKKAVSGAAGEWVAGAAGQYHTLRDRYLAASLLLES